MYTCMYCIQLLSPVIAMEKVGRPDNDGGRSEGSAKELP